MRVWVMEEVTESAADIHWENTSQNLGVRTIAVAASQDPMCPFGKISHQDWPPRTRGLPTGVCYIERRMGSSRRVVRLAIDWSAEKQIVSSLLN